MSKKEDKKDEEKPEKKGTVKMHTESRGKIYDDLLQIIGGTPLIRMPHLKEKYGLEADLVAKLEFYNPLGSIKDRTVLAMFEEAEDAGKITPGKTTIIEPSSGNTAVSLAFIASVKGYSLILTMPENVPFERRKLLNFYGAELFLTPSNEGMGGAIAQAEELMSEKKDVHMFKQFENMAGVQAHIQTTAKELWDDTEGKLDGVIAGVGSGATITGLAFALKKQKPDLKIYAVEPEESAVLSGEAPTQHQIKGIGVGFVPEILDEKSIDEIIKVHSNKAFQTAREVAKLEGIPCGISSGAALAAAIEVAQKKENKGKMIAVILPSYAERYISTELFEEPDKQETI